MLVIKVPKGKAQTVRNSLLKKGIFDSNHKVKSEGDYVFMPVTKRVAVKGATYVSKKLESIRKKPKTLKDALVKKLTKKQIMEAKTAFDVIGEIAILEDQPNASVIAKALLEVTPKVKTVLCKAGIHSGRFRTQKMKHLAGKKTKVSTVRENGVELELDVERVYFSVRLSTERKRISQLVKKGERILVLFSGCAPYPCVLAKNTGAKEIIGIELNPVGHKYGKGNLVKNKISNVKLYNEDARKAKKHGKFDRILMPLPKSAEEFLPSALLCAKKGTVIHLYTFGSEEEMKEKKKQVKAACKCRILKTVKCGQFSPRVYRYCIDFKLR